MPYWSDRRGAVLLTKAECASLFSKSLATIKRWSKKTSVYKESVSEKHDASVTRVTYIDPLSLGEPVDQEKYRQSTGSFREPVPQGTGSQHRLISEAPAHQTETSSSTENLAISLEIQQKAPAHEKNEPVLSSAITQAQKLYTHLKPALAHKKHSKDRRKAVLEVAENLGVDPKTIYRQLDRFEKDGIKGLMGGKAGYPTGKHRLPSETREIITSAFASNPPTTSNAMIYRTLLRAAPDAMTYSDHGTLKQVSKSTIDRIHHELLGNPVTALLFMDDEARKEYLRTWSGQVISNHANDMWQIDMTRCDVMVCDPLVPANHPTQKRIYRPRIQAVIDVFSGCIPGLAFSQEETQVQADLSMRRALLPKAGNFKDLYPIHGTPKRLYVDNGKVYTSPHFERYMSALGTVVIHSMAYVSHTRGKIERFFGTLHGFERTLPGYVGEDAKNRNSEGVEKLIAKTEGWLDHPSPQPSPHDGRGGSDPFKFERLLTIDEYQSAVAIWLLNEYHQQIVNGKTRLQWFLESAPEASLVIRNQAEMLLLMGRHEKRAVINGEFRYNNQRYWLPDGSLAMHPNGTEIIAISDPFILQPNQLFVALPEGDVLTPLGMAEPAPQNALSGEAKAARKLKKAQKQMVLAQTQSLAERIGDPNLRVTKALLGELGGLQQLAGASQAIQLPTPSPALESSEQESEKETDVRGNDKHITWLGDDIETDDPDEFYRELKKKYRGEKSV